MHKLLLFIPILLLLNACSQHASRGSSPYNSTQTNQSVHPYSLEALDKRYQLNRGK